MQGEESVDHGIGNKQRPSKSVQSQPESGLREPSGMSPEVTCSAKGVTVLLWEASALWMQGSSAGDIGGTEGGEDSEVLEEDCVIIGTGTEPRAEQPSRAYV